MLKTPPPQLDSYELKPKKLALSAKYPKSKACHREQLIRSGITVFQTLLTSLNVTSANRDEAASLEAHLCPTAFSNSEKHLEK